MHLYSPKQSGALEHMTNWGIIHIAIAPLVALLVLRAIITGKIRIAGFGTEFRHADPAPFWTAIMVRIVIAVWNAGLHVRLGNSQVR